MKRTVMLFAKRDLILRYFTTLAAAVFLVSAAAASDMPRIEGHTDTTYDNETVE